MMISDADVVELLDAVAGHGRDADGAYWRVAYSAPWRAAVTELAGRMAADGLTHRLDAVGNLIGRLEGTDPGPVVATGSHIDTALEGGQFDGAAGVIAGYLALRALSRTYGPPRRALELIAICDEENSRFKSDFWGSRAITGRVDPKELDTLVDADGVSIREAMIECGFDPEQLSLARRTDIGAWLELHVEQGPRLDNAGIPLAVVTGITGLRHAEHTVLGESNHAGGTPVGNRLDAMQGAAEMILAVDRIMRELGDPARATVGRVSASPGAPNTIADRVTFTTDLRHPDPAQFEQLLADIDSAFAEIADARRLGLERTTILHQAAVPMDGELVRLAERVAGEHELPFTKLASGGGHDAQVFAAAGVPSLMLFVPSVRGISHSPDEYTRPADLAAGARVLAEVLHRLAY